MEKNFKLITSKYLISQQLHEDLFKYKFAYEYKNFSYGPKKRKQVQGVYIINLSVLHGNSNCLVYNYINYRQELLESLIVYLLLRNTYKDTRLNERARKI